MLSLNAPTIIKGSVLLPASKSLANRQLLLQAAQGLPLSAPQHDEPKDVQIMRQALQLAAEKTTAEINVGPAGTAMRFLCAYLSTKKGEWLLTGSERMQHRPIALLVEALRTIGADIQYLNQEGFPPLLIKGKTLLSKNLQISSDFSSQYISALLLMAPFIDKGLELELTGTPVSEPYIKMSLEVLRQAGAIITTSGTLIKVEEGLHASPERPAIEADWTAASYYFSICALSAGSEILLKGLRKNSLQGDALLPDIFSQLGVTAQFTGDGLFIRHIGSPIAHFTYNCIDCPDLAQTLALTCAGLGISARLTGLSTLRIKETDRLLAVEIELSKCGLMIKRGPDFIEIDAQKALVFPQAIETYSDHRMAMAFAPLSIVLPGLLIKDEQVVGKSYPAFWEHLISLGFNVNLQPH